MQATPEGRSQMNVAAWCGVGALAWAVLSAVLSLAVGRTVTLAEEHRPHVAEPAESAHPSHAGA
jgi:hypothetical protein